MDGEKEKVVNVGMPMFTEAEKLARHKTIRQILLDHELKAIILIGDTNVGFGLSGDFRYYTAQRVIFYRQVAVVFRDSEPVHFTGSAISGEAARRRSFVADCRISYNIIASVREVLNERDITRGRVGVNFEMLPAAWYNVLREALPKIELVEVHDHIMDLRLQRSREESECYRICAALGDGCFEAALRSIKPGVSEYEIIAEIEHYARQRGAEENFTLIASGKFALGDENGLPLVYAPSPRRIESGDSVMMEITPRYEGYWTQLVRTVNVGTPNHDLEKLQEICVHAVQCGLKELRPGNTIKGLVLAMDSYVSRVGYQLRPPLGHFCGIDLVEARVSSDNNIILSPGMAVIVHPTVFTADGKNCFFWGETYLVDEDGYLRLHSTNDSFITL